MNKQESIELFRKGKDAWNKWAQGLLAEKQGIIHSLGGNWPVKDDWDNDINNCLIISDNPTVQSWLDKARVNFSEMTFGSSDSTELTNDTLPISSHKLDFESFIFPSEVVFKQTKFNIEVDFKECKFEGHAWFDRCQFLEKIEFARARFKGMISFNRSKFVDSVGFEVVLFEGKAFFNELAFELGVSFNEAIFKKSVGFNKTRFCAFSNFSAATFHDRTYFINAEFIERVYFNKANFKEITKISDAVFRSGVDFSNVTFEDFILFRRSKFYTELIFTGVSSDKLIDFSDAQFFKFVPDFTLLADSFPIRLSRLAFQNLLNTNQIFGNGINDPRPWCLRWMGVSSAPDQVIHLRGLKKKANEDHDHLDELNRFVDEMKARRFWYEMPFGKGATNFWIGYLYGCISDWGRSIIRPLFIWLLILLAFIVINVSLLSQPYCKNEIAMKPIEAASIIAVNNAFLSVGLEETKILQRAYICLHGTTPLYGVPEKYGLKTFEEYSSIESRFSRDISNKPTRLAPNISPYVNALGFVHSLFSLILFFLFGLAIRNYYRIK